MAPVITTQPASQIIITGYAVTFSVIATGTPTLTYQWYKNAVLISGAVNSSYAIAAVASTDAGNFTVRVTNGGGTVTSTAAVLTVATSILDAIELKMAALVAGMTKTGGYNFDWGMVNEQDESMPDASGNVNFPRCIIDPTDSVADKETNQDSLAGVGSNDYTNEVIFTLLVKGELPTFETNPLFAARSMLRQALDDLKMLFGIHLNLDSNCDNIMYTGSQIESLMRNDIQRPAQLRTSWKVVYSHDRQKPTLYASS